MTDWTLTVAGLTDHEIGGTDTTILALPEGFYVELEKHGRALLVQPLSRFLSSLANKQAADLGERLHHAEFVLTNDPSVIESRGSVHDCEECRAGVKRALRFLKEHPEHEMIVGQLFWAVP